MKTDQLIVQYLYSNKKVTLQEIGSFILSPEINISLENDKDTTFPPDAIQFIYDPKSPTDEGLIQYIMEHTGKMKALASSDLESFIMLSKQFLNIGKPLVLEGLGTLQKTQEVDFAFTQANTSHVIHEEIAKPITEKQKEKISFVTPQKEKGNDNGKMVIGIILFLLVVGIAFAAYYFMNKDRTESNSVTGFSDTLSTDTADSAEIKKTQDSLAAIKVVKDSNSFYVVINEYPNFSAAEKRLKTLTGFGNKVMLKTNDSLTYKIRMPFMLPLSDTLHIKDSLSKFFQSRTYIELP